MEVRDYNGEGIWTAGQIIARYHTYAVKFGVVPRDVWPSVHKSGGVRWVSPVMERVIEGIEAVTNAYVFQAGTAENKRGELVTSGGRVLAVSAFGKDVEQAITNTYRNEIMVDFDGRIVRTDIGHDLVKTPAAKPASAPQQV